LHPPDSNNPDRIERAIVALRAGASTEAALHDLSVDEIREVIERLKSEAKAKDETTGN
jgi:hypothetical protein